MMLRRALDGLYEFCGLMAGLLLVALCAFVLYSIGPGIGLWMKDTFGLPNPFVYVAASADEFAGFCMAGSAFLALAATFGRGEHIRVTLILQRFTGAARRRMELVCLVAGVFLTGYIAWFTAKMAYLSFRFGDLSTGLVAVKLWIPQSAFALGGLVFFIAMVDKLVVVARGGALVSDVGVEDAHIER